MTSCTFNTPLVCAALMAAGPSERGKTSVSIPLTSFCILASFSASRAGANGPHLQCEVVLSLLGVQRFNQVSAILHDIDTSWPLVTGVGTTGHA